MNIVFHSANNSPVGQRAADGYVNATQMCKAHNKRFDNYKKHEGYKPYVEALSNSLKLSELDLVQSRRGKTGSIWVHPRIAIHLAMWLSPEFAVEVIGWIETWITTGQNPVRSQPQPAPPPPQPPTLPPAPPMSAELSPDSELYQLFKEVGKREIVRRFFS